MTSYCVTHETGYCYDYDELSTATYFVVEGGEATPDTLDAVVDVFYAEMERREEAELIGSKEEYAELVKDSAVTTALGDTMYEVASDWYAA